MTNLLQSWRKPKVLLPIGVIVVAALILGGVKHFWTVVPQTQTHMTSPRNSMGIASPGTPAPAPLLSTEAAIAGGLNSQDPQIRAAVRSYFTMDTTVIPQPTPSPARKPFHITKHITLMLPDGYTFTHSVRPGSGIRELGMIRSAKDPNAPPIILGAYLDKASDAKTAANDVVAAVTKRREAKGLKVSVDGPKDFSVGKVVGQSVLLASPTKVGEDVVAYYMVKDEAQDYIYLMVRANLPQGKPSFEQLAQVSRNLAWQ